MSVVDVTSENFEEVVAQGWVLVDVWAETCQPCLKLGPPLEQLAEERGELTLAKVEAPEARDLCRELKVLGLPALVLFRDGEEVDRLAESGLGASTAVPWVEGHLDGDG